MENLNTNEGFGAEPDKTLPSEIPGGTPLPPEASKKASEEFETKKAEQAKKDSSELQKVKQDLKMESADDSADLLLAKKMESQYLEEINKSLNLLSAELQEFQHTLVINKFNRISFDTEGMRILSTEESETNKLIGSIQGIARLFRRDFVPEDEQDKLSLEPRNFITAIDSLVHLKGGLRQVRNTLTDRKFPPNDIGFKRVAEEVTVLINAVQRKADSFEESRSVLQRYRNR